MNQIQTAQNTMNPEAVRSVLLHGDLSKLSPAEKDNYYMAVCQTVGLNHLTKPFDFIRFQGKEVMYANKGCTEQLRMIHKIGLKIVSRERIEDVYVVTAEATAPDGRTDSSTGAVPIQGLKGEALANAFMKAETKAKRRVTLSICGLNMLDETEAETIQGAEKVSRPEIKVAEVQAIVSQPVKQLAQKPTSQSEVPQWVSEPAPDFESFQPHEEATSDQYIIPFGKYKGQTLEQVDAIQLSGYATWIETQAESKSKPLNDEGKDFIRRVDQYLKNVKV